MTALTSSVSNAELAEFCRQFGVMLASDVKLMPAVVTLRQQTENEYFREVLLEVQIDLENGYTLAAGLSRHPDVFSPFMIQLARQGEFEGALPEVFKKLAEHYSSDQAGAEGSFGGQVVVNLDMSTIVEVLRPLLVMIPTAVAFVGFAIAAIWFAMKKDWFPGTQIGPTVLMTGSLAFLLVAAAFSRFRPRRVSSCSFCGKLDTHVEEIVTSRGVAICNECVSKMVHQMRKHEAPAPPPEPAVPRPRPPAAEGAQRQPAQPDSAYVLREPNEPVDLDRDL